MSYQYVIQMKSGYYAREQAESCWSVTQNINEARVFYGQVEVDNMINEGLASKQNVLKGGYTAVGVTVEILPNSVLYRETSAEEVEILTCDSILKETMLEVLRHVDPQVFKNSIKAIHDRTLATRLKFKELSYISPEKMNRQFNS